MIGLKLENIGWRQGSIISPEDLHSLFNIIGKAFEGGEFGIVASQSCDIANNNTKVDPFIEVSIARQVDKLDGNLTHNKNPRLLQIQAELFSSQGVKDEIYFELLAHEKVQISKSEFAEFQPSSKIMLLEKEKLGYVSWLAARYDRPALPSKFNELIDSGKNRDKRKKKAKALNPFLSGLYVQIIPNREIDEGEMYSVNLLGMMAKEAESKIEEADSLLQSFAMLLGEVGINVSAKISLKSKVSIEVLERFSRFYYDDLSLRDDAEMPVRLR